MEPVRRVGIDGHLVCLYAVVPEHLRATPWSVEHPGDARSRIHPGIMGGVETIASLTKSPLVFDQEPLIMSL